MLLGCRTSWGRSGAAEGQFVERAVRPAAKSRWRDRETPCSRAVAGSLPCWGVGASPRTADALSGTRQHEQPYSEQVSGVEGPRPLDGNAGHKCTSILVAARSRLVNGQRPVRRGRSHLALGSRTDSPWPPSQRSWMHKSKPAAATSPCLCGSIVPAAAWDRQRHHVAGLLQHERPHAPPGRSLPVSTWPPAGRVALSGYRRRHDSGQPNHNHRRHGRRRSILAISGNHYANRHAENSPAKAFDRS